MHCRHSWLVACATLLVGAGAASAQTAQRYQPSRPTVSPYLNLFRGNVGPLPNYYSLVRPQLQQQAFNDQQLMWQAQQTAGLNLLQSQMQRNATATPTGKGSGFMTSDKYFLRSTGRR